MMGNHVQDNLARNQLLSVCHLPREASMSDKERDSAARRKRAADPNQPQKSGAAKPTNVSTDPKKENERKLF